MNSATERPRHGRSISCRNCPACCRTLVQRRKFAWRFPAGVASAVGRSACNFSRVLVGGANAHLARRSAAGRDGKNRLAARCRSTRPTSAAGCCAMRPGWEPICSDPAKLARRPSDETDRRARRWLRRLERTDAGRSVTPLHRVLRAQRSGQNHAAAVLPGGVVRIFGRAARPLSATGARRCRRAAHCRWRFPTKAR